LEVVKSACDCGDGAGYYYGGRSKDRPPHTIRYLNAHFLTSTAYSFEGDDWAFSLAYNRRFRLLFAGTFNGICFNIHLKVKHYFVVSSNAYLFCYFTFSVSYLSTNTTSFSILLPGERVFDDVADDTTT
jgi:hypothetical protein